ncbi:MAG: LysM peptidoglycan-binding domain-containing protein [Bacteroidales bacterium]|nr:LysM peptidoglycan-binding domain-containing protein [Bacteroidales bacterium]
MKLKHLIYLIPLLFLGLGFTSSGQEIYTYGNKQDSSQRRLFPTQKDSRRSHGKEDTKALIDSLTRKIRELEEELNQRDSLEREMVSLIEEESALPEDGYTVEKTDSLLSMWYLQNQISRLLEEDTFNDLEDIGEFNSDSVRFTTNVPDSILVERLKRMNSYITLPFNPIVKNYMILYSEKNVPKMKRILSLSDYYFPMFEEILSKYDMPLELKYMAIIESALNPVARSRAGAKGIWQFMYNTGRQYGLKINSFVDERMDVEKAADAAARYLMDAYNVFGDWALAISSYNCGPGNVNKAIRRAGRRDFWSIYPYLPRETRGYMPAFVGAMYAMTYYREYGIEPNPSPMPAHTDTFIINRNLHFGQISDLIGVPIEDLRELNAQYVHDIIPGNEAPYVLKLPYQYTNSFLDCQDTLYTHLADSLFSPQILKSVGDGTAPVRGGAGGGNVIRYKVRSGDYLGRIASRYHVSVRQIMNWNHLRSNNIRVGQVLTIYTGGYAPSPAASQAGSTSQSSGTGTSSTGEYTIYTVLSGDSLFKISQRYGVTVKAIMDLNHCSSNIKAGQKLKIPRK